MEQNNKPSKGIKAFLKSRKARHGGMAIALVIIVTAVVVVINIIANLLVDRFPNLKLDFTANSAYALQADTVDYMNHLNKDAKVTILMTESQFEGRGEYFVQAKNLLEKMVAESNGKLTLDYVDTTTNPGFTNKYKNVDWTSATTIAIVESGEQYQALTLDDCFTYNQEYYSAYGYYEFESTTIEQAVVTAVLNVTTEDKVVVDFIKGNQESDYTALKSLLTNNAYQVNEISLVTDELDENAKFVVLHAPAVDLDDSAVKKVSDWLINGEKYGRNLIYIPSNENVNTPNIDAMIEEWGVKLTEGFVFETSQDHLLNGAGQFAFITDYTDYYKEKLKNPDIPVVAFQSRGFEITDENSAHALLNTSNRAGVMPYEPADDWDFNDAISGKPIAVAAESVKKGSEAESRLILFGSDRMLSSTFMNLNSFNNAAYVMNIFNTISDKSDESIVIEGKSLADSELGVTDVNTTTAMMIIFVIVIPLGILIAGIIVWIRRRHL